MPISVVDLRFFASERMTDFEDGGGRMTATEIASGAENAIFDDLSDVDRAAGDCSIRKVFAAVKSDGADKYLDSGVVVLAPPADPAVSVVAFSTADHYDEREAMKAKLESGISRGARYQGYLWGAHSSGQRAVTLWQRPDAPLPSIGARIEMAAWSQGAESASQVLWITRTVDSIVTMTDTDGAYAVRQVVLELADPLRAAFVGAEPSRTDLASPSTTLYSTRYNHDAVALQGIVPLSDAASVGDYRLRVDSIYSPLIPTAFSETALPDVTPGGDTATLVHVSSGELTVSTSLNVVGPGKSWYLGTPVLPGSLTITSSGSTFTDDNGAMLLGGAQVGTVDYSNGVVRWLDTCPSLGTAAKLATYRQAAKPTRVMDTASQPVTVENRGYVWVITLAPIPQPGSLRVAYRVNNEWYLLADQGGGRLAGTDTAYGSGQVNFSSGTVTLTTGALPDPESEILYAWATAVNYFDRRALAPPAVVMRGQTANPDVLPGSVSITWPGGSLTDASADGELTGTGGAGRILYATGAWWVNPSTVPLMGAEFVVDYEYGAPEDRLTDSWSAPALGNDGNLSLTLSEPPAPGSLVLTVGATVANFISESGQASEDVVTPEPPPPTLDTPTPEPPSPAATYSIHVSFLYVVGANNTPGPSGIGAARYGTSAEAGAAVAAIRGAQSVSGSMAMGATCTVAGVAVQIVTVGGASATGPHSCIVNASVSDVRDTSAPAGA